MHPAIHERHRIMAGLPAALVVIGLLANSLAAQATPAPESTARFRVLKPDGTPLAGAEIQVQHYKGLKSDRDLPGERLKITTDADGWFTRPLGTGGSWRVNILVQDVGYILSERFETTAGQPIEQTLTLRPGATLSGRLLDEDTGQPVPKGWVNLYSRENTMSGNPQLQPSSGGRTDSEGRWTLTTVPDGQWELGANGPGYIFRGSAQVLAVRDGKGADGIELKLKRGAAMQVRFLGPDGKPVGGAKIKADLDRMREGDSSGSTSGGEYTTDAEGWVTFDGLIDSAWRVRARISGLGYAFSDTVEVKAADGPTKLTVQVKKGMSVSGQVLVAGTDRPVEKAWVYLRPVDFKALRVPLGSVRSDAEGFWQQTDVSPGQYVVCVQKESHAEYENEITVTEGQDATGLKAELKPYLPFRGLVLAPDGQTPVPGAVVRYGRTTVAADAQGRFTIVLPPGGATLAVAAAGFAAWSGPVAVREAADAPEERIVLKTRGTTVSGRVINTDTNQPASGLEVLVAKWEKDSWLDRIIKQGDLDRHGRESIEAFGGTRDCPAATTDASGSYSVEDLPPGEYVALVFPTIGVPLHSQPFKVVEGQPVDNLDFQVTRRPIGFVVLRFLGPDGRPLAGKHLFMNYSSEGGGQNSAGQLGPEARLYRRLKKTGTIQIAATVEGYAITEQTARVNDINVCLELDVKLTPEKADAAIAGRVLLPDGKTPAADVLVTPYVLDRPWPESGGSGHFGGKSYSFVTSRSVRTAADGTFRIERLRPARYGVQATPLKELCSWNEPAREELASYLPALSPTQVDAPQGGQVGGLEVTLGQGGSFEGQVLDATSGKPVAKARVELQWDRSGLFVGAEPLLGMWHVIALTDADGRFRIRGVPPEAYRLTVWADGYKVLNQSGWKGVKIKAGQADQRTIKLDPQ